MKNVFDIGFWLDLGNRIGGIFGNIFRWIFATKRRLQLVLLAVIVLGTLWGCSRMEAQRQAIINGPANQPSATATERACMTPNSSTTAERAAANIVFRICATPNYPDTRRAAVSRGLSISTKGASLAVPEPALVERFAFNIPNDVQQIGGADERGISTVLATSSGAKFLLGFDASGTLTNVQDITETPDVTPSKEATPTPTPSSTNSASGGATSTPTPKATTR
jgi:hypothetical protein